jgi:hypothetical protein
VDSDGLKDRQSLTAELSLLAALRGEDAKALAMLSATPDMRNSDDPQSRSQIAETEAFAAYAAGRIADSLQRALDVLEHIAGLGIGHEHVRWAWPLAARAAWDLTDDAATDDLLAMLDGHQPGDMAPLLLAERDLARARLAARHGDPSASAALCAAVAELRSKGTPYHLAHGLLDMATHRRQLTGTSDADAEVAAAVAEARDIARQLGCKPLLDRADAFDPATASVGLTAASASA